MHATKLSAAAKYLADATLFAGASFMKSVRLATQDVCKGRQTRLVLILVALGLLPAHAAAQTQSGGPTDNGVTAGFASAYRGAYPVVGIDTVNLYNGHVSLNLPLTTIGGRGSVSYQSTVSISRSLVMRHYQYWAPAGTGGTSWSQPNFKFISEGYNDSYDYSNVQAGLGPGVMIGRKMRDHNPNLSQGNPTDCTALTKLFLRIAGGEVEFRDAGTNGNPHYDGGYSSLNRGRVWRTMDGSAMTFISDADISDETCGDRDYPAMNGVNIIRPSGYLMTKDGTRYRFVNGVASWMRDRNGNTITFGTPEGVVDAAGRKYQVSDTDGVTYKGGDGTDRTVAVINGTLSTALRSDFSAAGVKTQQALFPSISARLESPTSPFDPVVIKAVRLPNNLEYHFYYDDYGQLSRVELPTGGSIEYDYNDTVQLGGSDSPQFVKTVKERRVYDAPGHLQLKQTFAYNVALINYTMYTVNTVTNYDYSDNPSGVILGKERHTFKGTVADDSQFTGWYQAYDNGREVKLEALDAAGQPLRQVDNTLSQQPGLECVLTAAQVKLLDTNQVSKTTFAYDSYGNVTDTYEYDFGSGAASLYPLRHTHTDYVPDAAYVNADVNPALGASLRGLPGASQSYSVNPSTGTETLIAKSETKYDESGYPLLECDQTIPCSSATQWSDTGTTARGNPTTVRRWLNTNGGWLESHVQYDKLGNARNSWDANGNLTQVFYNDSFADGNNSRNTFALPTRTESPAPDPTGTYGANTALVSASVYNFYTGLITSATDVSNNNTTTYEYGDLLDRLTRVNFPDGGRKTYSHVDTHQCGPYVETKTLLDSSGREGHAWQFFDGLGRPYLSESTDGQDSASPYLRVDTRYDAQGRILQVSNPYRTTGCTEMATRQWTTTEYDALGRLRKVTTPDGAAVSTSYVGNTVTVTDQTLKKRSSVSNALGHLVQVTEDPGGLAYVTDYTYDVLGNLRTVTQAAQTRTFVYDSLSRLSSATNPESGTVSYAYDNRGNLITKTDARGVVTTYGYDHLNRNTTITYADSALGAANHTKDVERHYDGAIKGNGRFWYSNWDAGGNQTRFDSFTAVDQYDAMGRPLKQRQRFLTGGASSLDYTTARTYDKAGNVLTETYPSGHAVKYNYDAAGRLGDNSAQSTPQAFTGNLGDGVPRVYAAGVTYSPFGGIQQEQFGTQTPLYHKLHYNRRGQLFDIRLSTVTWATDQWSWNRGALINYYGGAHLWDGDPNNPPATDNNGNLRQQQHWVPADDAVSSYSYTQETFDYDQLNRITSVSEIHVTPTSQSGQDYAQYFDYDRWGNRTINPATTGGVPEPQFSVNTATNRLGVPAGQTGQMNYDAAGNLINDSYSPGSYGDSMGQQTRFYDAESRMTAAADNTGGAAIYTYDADGRRVKRKSGNEEWWQVYGMSGELLAEYRAGAAPYLPAKEYGYRGGELLVTMSSGDDQRLSRFVQNLYYGALQRDPTSQELQDKVNQLATAGAQSQAQLQTTAAQVARALFTQTTYETSPSRSDRQYVSDLYYTYIQRAPDDSGLNWWTSLVTGNGRSNVCNAFESSSEFQTLVSTLYGTTAGDNQRTEQFVNNTYLAAYGRFATSTELQQQRDALNAAAVQGLSQVRAQAETMGRGLFAAQINDYSITDQQFVTNLYEGFLQRGPDAGGLSFWTGIAAGGPQNRQNVLNAFATCGPFRELSGTLYREAFWLVGDHLGTPRMMADKSGSLAGIKRHDYLPFGEGLQAGTGGRTVGQGYSGDNVSQKFTGKIRDGETGLDYFLARYYSSTQGRFTLPDEFKGGPQEVGVLGSGDPEKQALPYAEITNPQSLNKYTYCYNNPLRYIDPDGHLASPWHFLITYVAGVRTHHGWFHSIKLAWKNAAVDFRKGSQGTDAAHTNMHAMSGTEPGGKVQTAAEGRTATAQVVTNAMQSGDTALAGHAVIDAATPAHDGKVWKGYGLNGETFKHILGDLFPSPGTVKQAYENEKAVLQGTNPLAPTPPTTPDPSPPSPTTPPPPPPDPDQRKPEGERD